MPYYPLISTTGGAGTGSSNTATCTVDFANPTGGEQDLSGVTTVAAAWVTSATVLACTILSADSTGYLGTSLDHDPEDSLVEGITAYATNIVPGVGFDVQAYAANNSWGRYTVNITGQ